MIRFAEGTGGFTPLEKVQTSSGAQLVFHSIDAGEFSPLAKRSVYEAAIPILRLLSSLKMHGATPPTYTCYHMVVFNEAQLHNL